MLRNKSRIHSMEASNHRLKSMERYSEEESVEGGRISFFGPNELVTVENEETEES